MNPNQCQPGDSADNLPDSGIDALMGELLDEPEVESPSMTANSTDDQRRIAGLQFLHVLLQHLHRPDPGALEARVTRVMRAILESPVESPTASPIAEPVTPISAMTRQTAGGAHRRLLSRMLAAAVVLIACGLFWALSAPETAYAAVARALQAASQSGDREYQITALLRGPLGRQQTMISTLYVRGSERFALRHPAWLGKGEIWLGRDGSSFWLVPRIGPVLVSPDDQAAGAWGEQMQVSTPYLQITTILERMRDRYQLEFLPDVELPRLAGASEQAIFQRIRGVLRETEVSGRFVPRTIELWIDSETGAARRLVLDWQGLNTAGALQQVEIELAATPDLADDWYTHAAHHAPRRPVLEVERATSPVVNDPP